MRGLALPVDDRARRIYARVAHLTTTGERRASALIAAVQYVVDEGIPGDFVECGVENGGSIMVMALALLEIGAKRTIWLYDTFAGMVAPQPTKDGKKAMRRWEELGSTWCYCPIEKVKRNVMATGYPARLFRYVKGRVEDTIPRIVPERISLLRLDTDWYQSTKHELVYLYPLLFPGGVLLLDDYGHWEGARGAVKEYFRECGLPLSLERIDNTARIMIKNE